jgi:hypothetical protein
MAHQEHFCEVCGHTFASDEELKRHILSAHDIEVEDEELAEDEDEETAA